MNNVNLVIVGDSIGAGNTINSDPFASLDLGNQKYNVANQSEPGITLNLQINTRESRILNNYNSSYDKNVLVVQTGINDLRYGASAEQLYKFTTKFVADAHAKGFEVVVATVLPLTGWGSNSAIEQQRVAYNALVTANSAHADSIADIASDPTVGSTSAPANTKLYVDGLHPTLYAYQQYIEPIYSRAILAAEGNVPVGVTPTATPISTSIGSGSDTLVLKISQDAYQGDAQYTVSVDGKQIGGTLTAHASHAAGQSDTITVSGDWGPGDHAVSVNFLNDAYATPYSPSADRNLYIDGATYNGADVSGSKRALMSAGAQAVTVHDTTAAPSGSTPTATPISTSIGSGSDTLVLKISQDAYQGDAQYTVSVDGKQIGGTLTAHASHAAGQSDTITVSGDWGPGDHAVSVNFLNDAYATPYSPSADRNLYIDGATYNGADVSGSKRALMSAGAQAVTVHDTTAAPSGSTPTATPISTSIGSGSDTLVLKISQDAYQGDAQYTVSVDGKQIGGTLTAHASHAAGQSDTITVSGDWGPGDHAVSVNFLNDAYATPYSPSADRNLYIDGATYNGADVSGSKRALMSAGAQAVTVHDTTAAPSGSTPTATPISTSIGSGSDTLVLKISQDAYQGDAQYTVSVDGKQIGGTLTAHASHAAGQSDTITVSGDWGPGDHAVSVNFLNDAYATPYSPSADRNLYIDGATYNGADVSGSKRALMSAGAQAVTVHDTTAAPSGSTPTATPISTSIGSGSDTLVLKISQDAYQGDAQYTVSVDGKQIGGTLTAHASHAAGQSDTITVSGDWGPGDHAVSVNFLNDAYATPYSPSADRNLYIDGATYNGADVSGSKRALMSAGAQAVTVHDTTAAPSGSTPTATPISTSIGSGSDTLVLKISQDAYQGDAQYTVSVDGKQIGGTLTAHASHAAGQSDTITVSGDWGPGDHAVSVNFLNDAYATPYSPSADRNLYIDGATYNGADVSGSKHALMSAGAQAVTVHDTNVLIGGPGAILAGGNGPDTFVFQPHFGQNTVTNFTPGTDTLQIDKNVFESFGALSDPAQHSLYQDGANVVIDDHHGDTIVLQNLKLAALHASDFAFI